MVRFSQNYLEVCGIILIKKSHVYNIFYQYMAFKLVDSYDCSMIQLTKKQKVSVSKI